jgi:hypothetical protein
MTQDEWNAQERRLRAEFNVAEAACRARYADYEDARIEAHARHERLIEFLKTRPQAVFVREEEASHV